MLRERKCSLCLWRPIPSSVLQLPVTNLKKKYYFPQVETYHFRTANNLIYGTPPPNQTPAAARPSRSAR